MSTLAYSPNTEQPVSSMLLLRSTDSGWALSDARGEIVFSAEGRGGRQACLEFARDHGVLALIR